MLGNNKLVAFVATTDGNRARQFYGEVLGLKIMSDDPFAVVCDAGGDAPSHSEGWLSPGTGLHRPRVGSRRHPCHRRRVGQARRQIRALRRDGARRAGRLEGSKRRARGLVQGTPTATRSL